ncbi:MAG: ABC transporter substrate-binding protein [Thermomicrobiales bacterium]
MVSGPDFDQKMGEYLRGMREHSLTRRGLLKAAGGAAGAAALMGGAAPLLSGFGVLAADADTITYGLESDPRGVEPALAYDFTANVVVNNITEGLMRVDGQGKLQPHLAEKYDHPDPLTYIYTLRAGVKFHDGTPMTVADVLASIDRTRSNKTIASPMSWMFDSVASIDQSADNQITIKLKQPSGTFQFVASVTAMHVMPKSKIDANATQPILDPVGTGPYKFVKWDSGSEIDLVKNDAYWQTGKPHFKNVVFKIIGDPTTRITGLKTGDLNEVREILPDQLETVRALTNVQLLDVIGYTINMIVMVNDKPPFNDPKIREAVSLAVDVDSLLANLVKDAGIRSHATTVPPNMPGSASDQLQPVAFDLTKAKAALAASTMPDGFKTTLLVDAENSLRVAEAQAVQ